MAEYPTEVLQDHPQIIKELITCIVDLTIQYSKTYNNKIMEINQPINAEQQAQQKEYKHIKDAMKADIKQQSSEQIIQKKISKDPNAPTVMSHAQQLVHLNGVDLRHLFIAYAIFRHRAAYGKGIPESNYTWNFSNNSIIRKDGKAITKQENAPRTELITKILEKYGAEIKPVKTVHINS